MLIQHINMTDHRAFLKIKHIIKLKIKINNILEDMYYTVFYKIVFKIKASLKDLKWKISEALKNSVILGF